jgi:hypothetical protein
MGHRKGKPAANKGMPHWTDADYMAKLKSQCIINDAGCWVYQGFLNPCRFKTGAGYGYTSYRGKNWRNNRLAYFLTKGPIPKGLIVRHKCDVPACCNPDHLILGTQKQNIRDGIERGRQRFHKDHHTHCPKGHPLSGPNMRLAHDPRGYVFRQCKACQRASTRKRAGWPESHWYIEPGKLGQRPSFESDRGVAK